MQPDRAIAKPTGRGPVRGQREATVSWSEQPMEWRLDALERRLATLQRTLHEERRAAMNRRHARQLVLVLVLQALITVTSVAAILTLLTR